MFKMTVNDEQLANLNTRQVHKAVNAALLRLETSVIAEWSRYVTEVIALPAAEVKAAFSGRASGMQLEIGVRSPVGIPLSKFQPKQDAVGTSVVVRKASGRKTIPHAFMWRGEVFKRVSRKRLPIKRLYSTDVEDVAKDTLPRIEVFAQNRANIEIVRAVKFYFGK